MLCTQFCLLFFASFVVIINARAHPFEAVDDSGCGCDDENREMMHNLQKNLAQMSSPHLVKQRAADFGYDDVNTRGHSHAFVDKNMQPREAKVNEYFYKSDGGHSISPYSFVGKDGRIYNNYRPDHEAPIDQMAASSRSLDQHLLMASSLQAPSSHSQFMMRRGELPESRNIPATFLQKLFNPRRWGLTKRNDDSEMAESEYYGYGVRPPVWGGYQGADWAASNMSPVPARMHPPAHHHPHHPIAPMNPSGGPMMQRYNMMDTPIHLNSWYNFLNQPMYGPMAGHTFTAMEGPTAIDGQMLNSMESVDKPSGGGNSSNKEGNSSEESGEKKPSNRQRSRWQINLSRIPIANLRNLFRMNPTTTSTSTTESTDSI